MACAQTGSGKTVNEYFQIFDDLYADYIGCFSLANYFQFIGISYG
jgi:hypothetical protein